jgi:hypothetical protein
MKPKDMEGSSHGLATESTEQNHEKSRARIAGLRFEIWTQERTIVKACHSPDMSIGILSSH